MRSFCSGCWEHKSYSQLCAAFQNSPLILFPSLRRFPLTHVQVSTHPKTPFQLFWSSPSVLLLLCDTLPHQLSLPWPPLTLLFSQLSKVAGLCLDFSSLCCILKTASRAVNQGCHRAHLLVSLLSGIMVLLPLAHVWKWIFIQFSGFLKCVCVRVCACVREVMEVILFLLFFYGWKQNYVYNFYIFFFLLHTL